MNLPITRKTLLIGVATTVAVLTLGVVLALNWNNLWQGEQVVSTAEPIDVVFDFYDPWLAAWQASTTDPYKEGLAKAPILSEELRKRLKTLGGDMEVEPDLVTCQKALPPGISARLIFQNDTEAQVVVVSTQTDYTEQAVVTLRALSGGWYIDDIVCSLGEFGPEREFSFEREGYLLKSVPPPYNPAYWHIVFEESGEKGHAAPLFFSAESTCTTLDGNTATCNPDQLQEATKVLIKGSMTELGVQVKKLELVK